MKRPTVAELRALALRFEAGPWRDLTERFVMERPYRFHEILLRMADTLSQAQQKVDAA